MSGSNRASAEACHSRDMTHSNEDMSQWNDQASGAIVAYEESEHEGRMEWRYTNSLFGPTIYFIRAVSAFFFFFHCVVLPRSQNKIHFQPTVSIITFKFKSMKLSVLDS
jgi:hypothetical protein